MNNPPVQRNPDVPAGEHSRPALFRMGVELWLALGCALWLGTLSAMGAADASSLRLVPFPKEVRLESGTFDLNRRLVLEISQDQADILGEEISRELQAAGFGPPALRPLKTAYHVLRLAPRPRRTIKNLPLRPQPTPEDYVLEVRGNAIHLSAASQPGLCCGAQTLRQLIRANRQKSTLPALLIQDWPALTWRAFQDDVTRGPSSTAVELEREVALGAFFKLNVFTYYMEHQFAFQKHPVIGPPDGSLTAPELQRLVAFAQPRGVNVLGNQQSFGHFSAILAHPEFASLRETASLLCPTNARTYELLNDLYSEVAPLLPFPYFNVCCDETEGLGTGPSKPLADRLGPGALYVQHVRRLHELLATNYHKRMMMWGDIILRHPDQLAQIPKDTVLLTWAYDARASFEDQILPFANAGYQFWVCPGVNGWSRILPDFATATVNIRNFVRDGLMHGARGMLNTAWDDDGETFNAPNWHGFAWGAECAWSGSTTSPTDFDRRLGAVLFGPNAEAFGQAIELLSSPGLSGLPDSAFWQFSFASIQAPNADAARASWEKCLQPIRSAIATLECCRQEATCNAELLDYFLFGARRLQLRFTRELDRLQASLAYRNARTGPWSEALGWVERSETILRSSRDAHQGLSDRYAELWNRENKPYALDWTLQRYGELIAKYNAELDRLARARQTAKSTRSLPQPRDVGLELIETDREKK